jgi:hypothetical protein
MNEPAIHHRRSIRPSEKQHRFCLSKGVGSVYQNTCILTCKISVFRDPKYGYFDAQKKMYLSLVESNNLARRDKDALHPDQPPFPGETRESSPPYSLDRCNL